MSYLDGLLSMQGRARRNALSAVRVLHVRRDDQVEADRAVRVAAATSPDAAEAASLSPPEV